MNVPKISSLEDISALKEGIDVECKLAQGKDGKGALPKSFWETYSAFANTEGGYIFLGLREKSDGDFELAGIKNAEKVINELWATMNSTEKVSANILQNSSIRRLTINGKMIIQVYIPRAPRERSPVFISGNPLTGTYRRLNSTDISQDNESVRRMIAEQVEKSRDAGILVGYGLDDLDTESFSSYRQHYINLHPDHPWSQLDAQQFLHRIGGWHEGREPGRSGLTRAGLLMFGQTVVINEIFPNYMLDYQEQSETKSELRWVDRLTPDGSWSGNVHDFYMRVIRKLTSELKVPFRLKGDRRQDDTPAHKALREALVNTLIHADYTGRTSILVVKRPNMFLFRNPGSMRIPVELAKSGGYSDCRNRLLQKMFRFIGLGERAGSGLPKILSRWESQHWRQPMLKTLWIPSEHTLLELHATSLLPEGTIEDLRAKLGDSTFDGLTKNERLTLTTAHIEATTDYSRMMQILNIHPKDLSFLFRGLVDRKLLLQGDSGHGTIYRLPSVRKADFVGEWASAQTSYKDLATSSGGLAASSGDLSASSGGLAPNSGDLSASSGGLAPNSGGLSASSPKYQLLDDIAATIANRRKAPQTEVEAVILKLCAQQEMRMENLTRLLNRSPETLRKGYLKPLLKGKKLRLKYPTKPNHPKQAYLTEKVRNE